jgi:hypothetical protein
MVAQIEQCLQSRATSYLEETWWLDWWWLVVLALFVPARPMI